MNTQDFCFILKQNSHLLREGCFGLEKENVRVNQDGTLALTPHPAVFGDKGKHPYITTDFSESQVEMITPPLPSVGEALGFMETLHDVVTENIGDELLWPQSLPPVLKENQEIPIAHYSGEFKDKEYYRQKLAGTYGKERQLISGIHFNFSFSEKLMDVLLKSGVCGSSMEEVGTSPFRLMRSFPHGWTATPPSCGRSSGSLWAKSCLPGTRAGGRLTLRKTPISAACRNVRPATSSWTPCSGEHGIPARPSPCPWAALCAPLCIPAWSRWVTCWRPCRSTTRSLSVI